MTWGPLVQVPAGVDAAAAGSLQVLYTGAQRMSEFEQPSEVQQPMLQGQYAQAHASAAWRDRLLVNRRSPPLHTGSLLFRSYIGACSGASLCSSHMWTLALLC